MIESNRLFRTTTLALLLAALSADAGAETAQPAYIRADRGAITKSYGAKIAARVFSNEFTPTRAEAIAKSAARIPGFQCPAEPKFALLEILPFPVAPRAISWVERYAVECEPRVRRNLMLFLENEKSRAIELLPGETKADPQLQRDSVGAAKLAAHAANPPGCEKSWVTDTREIEPYKGADTPWLERWTLDLCGKNAEVEMTFTPTGGNTGTDFSAKLIK